jgi:transcriptional regulator with GAF, ATPase, and Fis domain
MSEDRGVSLREAIGRFERAEILDALERTGWVKARAARRLGITERMIGYKIRKYGITKEVKEQGKETQQGERRD